MKINWKVRFSNPLFIAQLLLAVLTPVLAYLGLNLQDLTTWSILGGVMLEAIKNPYVLGLIVVNVFNTVTDPTTPSFSDSDRAMTYGTAEDVRLNETDITEMH